MKGGVDTARYIDADNLKKSVESWLGLDKYYHPYSKGKNIPTSEVYDIIETEPTAEVVPRERFDKVMDNLEAVLEERDVRENNAEVFKSTFGIYATELWSMEEKDFLEWLNSRY